MQRKCTWIFVILALAEICTADAQSPGKGSQSSTNSPTAASLQGLSYEKSAWSQQLGQPPAGANAILCYKLEAAISSSQPYLLRPVQTIDNFQIPIKGTNSNVPCLSLDDKHPLMMDSQLVIAIDTRDVVLLDRLRILNINITTQSGSPLSPTPLRPSFGAGSVQQSLGPPVYFLAWPNRLPGDIIPTVTVSTVYTPPSPGDPWQRGTVYPAGSIVAGTDTSGAIHYYMTHNGGISGGDPFTFSTASPITDGNCTWASVGITNPSGSATTLWAALAPHKSGDYAFIRSLQLYFEVVNVPPVAVGALPGTPASCTSGNDPSVFVSSGTSSEPFPTAITDDGNGTVWQWIPDTPAFEAKYPGYSCATHLWSKKAYNTTDLVCDPRIDNQTFMVTASNGHVEATEPNYNVPINVTTPVWMYIGDLPPSTAAVPSDQVLTLLNMQLPQSHSLYYYNLASGVLVTTIRQATFAYTTAVATNNGTPEKTGSSLLIDPVVSFTRYVWPIDAERKMQWSDVRPGVTLSFSLSSPTSNFYFGGSSELLRYIQAEYGFALAKAPQLATSAIAASSSTTPTTVQVFKKGAYFGFSFNISGLIQGLTGSGGGSSGGGKSGGSGGGSSN